MIHPSTRPYLMSYTQPRASWTSRPPHYPSPQRLPVVKRPRWGHEGVTSIYEVGQSRQLQHRLRLRSEAINIFTRSAKSPRQLISSGRTRWNMGVNEGGFKWWEGLVERRCGALRGVVWEGVVQCGVVWQLLKFNNSWRCCLRKWEIISVIYT